MKKTNFKAIVEPFLNQFGIKPTKFICDTVHKIWYAEFTSDVEFSEGDYDLANEQGLTLSHNCVFGRVN